MKTCAKCLVSKDKGEFHKHKDSKDGLRYECKQCRNERCREERRTKPEQHKQTCKNWLNKPGKKRQKLDKTQEWRLKNPEKTKASKLRHNYGISLEEYHEMHKKQDSRCKICTKHQDELETWLCVDHDHKTNKIRGLLCKPCNLAIGNLQYSPENWLAAAKYLNQSSLSEAGILDEIKQITNTT